VFNNIFRNKTVLVTGHTGFKGSWLCIWLKKLGADVVGYALEPYTQKDNFVVAGLEKKITHIIGDIRDFPKLISVFKKYQPEFVFHLAAQPVVRESYANPKETYDINVGGTINVLECCRLSDTIKVIINVTSDKCYENKKNIWSYRENDPVGGYDPYSSSKGCSELITAAYRNSFFNPLGFDNHKKSLSSARAGNVIGGGDWQKDRIIPDCIRALENNKTILIRNPNSVRPWQHVLDCLCGYLLLASKMYEEPSRFCDAWNFGPSCDSMIPVSEIVNMVIAQWGKGGWIPKSGKNEPHELGRLSLDTTMARTYLKWFPVWSTERAVMSAISWYKNYRLVSPYQICLDQINEFEESLGKVVSERRPQRIPIGTTPSISSALVKTLAEM